MVTKHPYANHYGPVIGGPLNGKHLAWLGKRKAVQIAEMNDVEVKLTYGEYVFNENTKVWQWTKS